MPLTRNERQRLVDALKLLDETREYLTRLPAVPATTELARRLSTFVEESVRQHVGDRHGRFHAPDGRPLLDVFLSGDVVEIRRVRQDDGTYGTISLRQKIEMKLTPTTSAAGKKPLRAVSRTRKSPKAGPAGGGNT